MTDINDAPNEPPEPTTDPEPDDPTPEPSTEPPLQPAEPVFFQPYLWYAATCCCATNTCVNYNVVQQVPQMYSNNGTYVPIFCGLCSKRGTILSAVLLDPQPPEE